MGDATSRSDREFARIPVELGARFRVLDEQAFKGLSKKLLTHASVWAPSEEKSLIDLATAGRSQPNGMLARAILDISAQVQRLSYRVLEPDVAMERAELAELSAKGCRLGSPLMLERGSLLEMRILDDGTGVPPVRVGAEVVHTDGAAPARYGVRFVIAHPTDIERLIRYIYQRQRETLRSSHM